MLMDHDDGIMGALTGKVHALQLTRRLTNMFLIGCFCLSMKL